MPREGFAVRMAPKSASCIEEPHKVAGLSDGMDGELIAPKLDSSRHDETDFPDAHRPSGAEEADQHWNGLVTGVIGV